MRNWLSMKTWLSFGLLALGVGCSTTEVATPGPTHGTLDLELRDEATVEIQGTGSTPEVSVTFSAGHGVAPAGEALHARGRVDEYPEADITITSARFDTQGDASGPCGQGPVSLALSLHRDGDNERVGGALTAYCGRGVWVGRPARVLRLDGVLPR